MFSITSTAPSFTVDPTYFLHYLIPPHQLIYSDLNKRFLLIVPSFSFCLNLFLPRSLRWLRAKHMVSISLRDSGQSRKLSFDSDDLQWHNFQLDHLSANYDSPWVSDLSLSASKLQTAGKKKLSTHTIKIRSKGGNYFIKNQSNKWAASFTNSVWTGDSNCKLVLGPMAAASFRQLK